VIVRLASVCVGLVLKEEHVNALLVLHVLSVAFPITPLVSLHRMKL